MKGRILLLFALGALLFTMAVAASTTMPTSLWTRVEDAIYTGFKVGVGTSNPQAPLHVVGNAIITGDIRAHKLHADEVIEGGVPLTQKYVNYGYLSSRYYTRTDVDRIVAGNYTALKDWVLANYYDRVRVDELILGNYTELKSWVTANYYNKTVIDVLIAGNITELKNWIIANYYDKTTVDSLILGNYTALKQWVDANYYNKTVVDMLVTGNITELKNWVITNYYDKSAVDALITGNITELKNWVIANYYDKATVDSLILGNYTELKRWVEANYYDRIKVDELILGNYTDLRNWVIANYYDKATIDSWNLIKNYVLEQDLNANGHSIINAAWVQAANVTADYIVVGEAGRPTGWYLDYFPDTGRISFVKYGSGELLTLTPDMRVGIGTVSPRAKLEVVGDVMLSNPDGRYIRFFFGALNDLEFNATAFIIHPVWQAYNPSGLVFFSGDPNYIKVGIGTDNPQYRLDVNGDIRAIGASVYADYFKLTEGGSYTGWEIDYIPDNGRMVIVKDGVGEILSVNPSRWVNITGWLKVEPWAGALTSPPSGWTLGVWTFDIYAEGTIATGRNGEVKAYLNAAGDIKGAVVYADYFRLTEGGNWGSVSGTSSGWEIDYYPEGTMVFRYTNDNGQTYREVMKLWTFGVATPFAIDKNFLGKIDSIQLDLMGVSPEATEPIVDITWTGTIIVSIYSDDWMKIDSITINVDGVSRTFTFTANSAEGTLTMIFTVGSKLRIEVHNKDTSDYAFFRVMIVKVAG